MDSKEFFIDLLSCYLNSETPQCNIQVNWSEIFALSEKHGVTAVISEKINDLPEEKRPKGKILSSFNQELSHTIKNYENKTHAVTMLVKILSDAQINHLLIKGAVLRYLYPSPELRTSGDTDVVISPADYEKAVEKLEQSGFTVDRVGTTVAELTYNGEKFEIHTELEYINIQSKIYFSTPFDDISEHSGYTYKLKPFYHLLYVITHIAHHLKNGGAGVRMIMDIDALLRYYPETDIKKFTALCDNIRIKETALVLIALSKKWFNTPVVIDYTFEDNDQEKFYKKLCNIIIEGGAFDADSKETDTNCPNGNTDKNKKAGLISSAKVFFRRIFPRLSYMIKFYPYCKEMKILVPVAWFHNLILVMFGKSRDLTQTKQAVFSQNNMPEKYYEVLKELQIESNTHYD